MLDIETTVTQEDGNLRQVVKELRNSGHYGRTPKEGRDLRRHVIENHNFRVHTFGGGIVFMPVMGILGSLGIAFGGLHQNEVGFVYAAPIFLASVLAGTLKYYCFSGAEHNVGNILHEMKQSKEIAA